MPSRDYHESLWEGVPEGLPPAHARLREAFLLERLGSAREHSGHPPRVLDVGCGEGYFAAVLERAGAEVLAIDVAEEPLRRAQALNPELDVLLVKPEGTWPLADAGFDLIWAGETIEHVADTSRWLSEIRRVLRSGGTLALSTPDHGPLSMLSLALRGHARDTHFDPRSDHLRFYTRRTLAALLADYGFADVAVRPAAGLPGARRVLLASARRKRF
jgi:2-polyprenyl-3-methyl-5-hydroxy-6-metoxy-1,4-benzoquinol methylase